LSVEEPGLRAEGPVTDPGDQTVAPAPQEALLNGRVLDLFVGVPAAVISAPIVGALAAAIRLDSPGPAIYRQRRVGKGGQEFSIFKLRTMVVDAEFKGAGLAVEEHDDRITRVGRVLRRYSLDELPNLWNVLRGEMSVVGPRPTVMAQVEQYTQRQRGRLAVRPGLTGWAQVNGRASLLWSERIELDLWYVEHRSLRLDLRILAQTIKQVLLGQGLYHEAEHGGWIPPQ
jgi:lipopolysaccharide/colanic/teichoic acid biosynthesis glycosyltransferase